MTTTTTAQRIATVERTPEMGSTVSYWQHGSDVYRLNEYEPVQFDIYGLPLGARWECSRGQFDRFYATAFAGGAL
jgi:hypothetical protein